MTDSAADKIFERAPEHRPVDSDDTQLMRFSLQLAIDLKPDLTDLKIVILRNCTNAEFITSDNPAVLTNRFHFQKLKRPQFGFRNSGAILSMPLSPKLSMFLYDTGVYTVPNATGTPYVEINHINDVTAINELQFLSAGKNVYFSRWQDASHIGAQMESLSDKRANARHKTQVFVRDVTVTNPEIYRRPALGEEQTASQSLIATGYEYPEPNTWPSKVKYRSKPKVFYNGTGVGHVRKDEWLRSR